MKLKLLQSGYENLTGLLGVTFFENGLSVDDVPLREARNIAIAILCEYEDGSSANPAQGLLDNMSLEAKVTNPGEFEQPEVEKTDLPVITRAELEVIADKGGIKALREKATIYGVKGTSIAEIIKEILEAIEVQEKAKAE